MADRDNDRLDGIMDISMDDFEKAMESATVDDELRPGDKVNGKVLSIGKMYAFLDIGTKSEGVLPITELLSDDGEPVVKVGDVIQVKVIKVSDEIILSYKLKKGDQTRELLQDAYESRVPVQGRVMETNKGGFVIDLGGQRAFCPISQIDIDFVNDPKPYLNQTYHFVISRYDPTGRNIVVSRAVLLKEEARKKAQETLKNLKPGMIIKGIVKRITDFGVFVDIGGLEGLVHISALSWDRVSRPSDIVSLGAEIQVKVLSIEEGGKRVSLSLKEVEGDPWDAKVGTDILEGHSYKGTVMRMENYGAFVRLLPGIEGLLHISEISWGKPIKHPDSVLKVGEEVTVQVIGIDRGKKRISLSLKQLTSDPWDLAVDSLIPGAVVEAEVSKIKSAGLEVKVREHVYGFVPASMTGVSRGDSIAKAFEEGKKITAKITEVNREKRRLILEVVDLERDADEKEAHAYLERSKENQKQAEAEDLSSFGERLSDALKKE